MSYFLIYLNFEYLPKYFVSKNSIKTFVDNRANQVKWSTPKMQPKTMLVNIKNNKFSSCSIFEGYSQSNLPTMLF